MNDSNFEYSNKFGNKEGCGWDYDPLDTEMAELELERIELEQEWIFQRALKLRKLIALYKLHDELKDAQR